MIAPIWAGLDWARPAPRPTGGSHLSVSTRPRRAQDTQNRIAHARSNRFQLDLAPSSDRILATTIGKSSIGGTDSPPAPNFANIPPAGTVRTATLPRGAARRPSDLLLGLASRETSSSHRAIEQQVQFSLNSGGPRCSFGSSLSGPDEPTRLSTFNCRRSAVAAAAAEY